MLRWPGSVTVVEAALGEGGVGGEKFSKNFLAAGLQYWGGG